MKILTLTTGAQVKVREVSPMLFNMVVGKRLKEPPFPMVNQKSVAGGEENLPAMRGTPEFDEYEKKHREYRKKLQEESIKFHTNVAVVAWRFSEDEEWQEQVPEDWELPFTLQLYGVEDEIKTPTDRRYFYIMTELLGNTKDEEAVDRIALSQEVVTEEEVQSALSPFDSEGPSTDH